MGAQAEGAGDGMAALRPSDVKNSGICIGRVEPLESASRLLKMLATFACAEALHRNHDSEFLFQPAA
jgi:hypothetical protein